jgi:hypothetical protein
MAADEVVDFYQIDALLNAEEKKVRDTVRAFVDKECMPVIAEHFDKGTFPVKLIPEACLVFMWMAMAAAKATIRPTASSVRS